MNIPLRFRLWRGRLFLSVLILLLLILSLTEGRSVTHAASTLSNTDFEGTYNSVSSTSTITGQVASGWQDDSAWTSDLINYSRDTSIVHGGASSQKIEIVSIGSGQAMQFVQPLTLSANQTYNASVWLRGTPGLSVSLSLRLRGSPYTNYTDATIQLSDSWTQITCIGQTPSADVVFMLRTTSPGTIWVDDAALNNTPSPAVTPPSSTIPRTYFGMGIKGQDTAWPVVDFGTLRLWDSGVQWAALETARGTYDFSKLDAWVGKAQQHNAQVILTLGQTPQWASSRPNEASPYGNGAAAPPADIQDWKDYVTTVVNRYKGRIQAYEIWNEPDLSIFYTGTVAQMIPLASSAYSIIKSIDSSASIISPASSGSVGWLENLIQQGGANYFDVIGFHFYATPPEDMAVRITNVRLLLDRYNLSATKPLWNTEAASGNSQTPDLTGAGYVARVYLLNWLNSATRYAWYAWDNHDDLPGGAPMVKTDNVSFTQAAATYNVIQKWLVGSKMLSQTTDSNNTWVIQLQRADGSNSWAIWNPDQSVNYSIPSSWNIQRLQDITGTTADLGGVSSVQVGATPILLEQNQASVPAPLRPATPAGISPTDLNSAASYSATGGGNCQVSSFGGNIGSYYQGAWLKYSNVNLTSGLTTFTASLQTFSGVNAHIKVILDANTGPGCGLATGGALSGGTQIADLTVTPSSQQDFSGPYASESTSVSSNYSAGQHDLYLLATGNIGNLANFQLTQSAGALPSGWSNQDIGSVGVVGSSTYTGGTYTLKGSGDDIWNSTDAFHFAYQSLSGDGQIVARIVSQGNTDGWAKAGVMIRNTLDNGSANVLVGLTPLNGVNLGSRSSLYASSNNISGPNVGVPYWVKLVRQGNLFAGYTSNNGSNWSEIGRLTISMNGNVYIGLAVSSHNNAVLSTATFDNVAVGPVTTALSINPTSPVNAASASSTGGGLCQTTPFGTNIGSYYTGSWLKFANVDFPADLTDFSANLQTFTGVNAHVKVILDATTGPGCGTAYGGVLNGGLEIGELTVQASSPQDFNGPYSDQTTSLVNNYPRGLHNLYLLATGNIGNIASFKFFRDTSLPLVTTGQSIEVTPRTAKLNAQVSSHSSAAVKFEYGINSGSYPFSFIATPEIVKGTTASEVSANITGLLPNTYYYYRVIATNPNGTSTGSEQSFRTALNVSDFNIFTSENISLNNGGSSVAGKLAAGQNASFVSYNLAFASPEQTSNLIVGGDLSLKGGKIKGNAVYGGKLVVNSNTFIGGSSLKQNFPLELYNTNQYIQKVSQTWQQLRVNGFTTISYGSITLTGTSSYQNIFALKASDLATANRLNVQVPSGASVIINVSGTNIRLTNFGITLLGVDRQHLVFNLYEATSVSVNSIGIDGSIWSPLANISFSNAHLKGVLIAKSLTGGSAYFDNYPFLGKLLE